MNVLILTQFFPPEVGAAQSRLGAVARELVRRGHRVEVVTAVPNYPQGEIPHEHRGYLHRTTDWEGVRVHRVWVYPSKGRGLGRALTYFTFAVTSIVGLISTARPHLVLVESPPLPLVLIAGIYAKLRKTLMIVNVADLWPDSLRDLGVMKSGLTYKLLLAIEAWGYRNSAAVTTVTDGLVLALVRGKKVPANRVLILPNGVDVDRHQPLPRSEKTARDYGVGDKKVILYAGTHGRAHGCEVALRAAAILSDEFHFLFVGDGSEKERLKQLASDLKLRNVTFEAAVPLEAISELHSIALCGLSTLRDADSAEATRPAKIFATMACGKPVVYVGHGEGAQLVAKAGAGVVVPPGDPEKLAAVLRSLAEKPEWAARMGNAGRDFVVSQMSWEKLVDSWLIQVSGVLREARK